MGLPTAPNIATVSSETMTLRGGKDFSIELIASYSSAQSYSMEVADIDGYEYKIDIEEDTDDVSEFFINVPQFKFSFWSDVGIDFGNILHQLSFTDLVEIKITYDGNTDRFLCKKKDFTYNAIKRTVECKCYSPSKFGGLLTTEQLESFDLLPYEFDAVGLEDGQQGDTFDYKMVTYRDLLSAVLDTFDTQNKIIESSYDNVKNNYTNLSTGEGLPFSGVVTVDNGVPSVEGSDDEFLIETFEQGRSRVLEGSLAEGALFGSGFGTSFYVRRNSLNHHVNVSLDELEDFGIEFFESPVKKIAVGNGEIINEEVINSDNPQTVNVTIPNFNNGLGNIDRLSNGDLVFDIFASTGEISFDTIYTDALEIYKKVLGCTDSIKWRGVIWDASKVKPWNTIVLDTSISEYLNTNNNIIRPSKLKYDLVRDKIEFEGYSI